MKDQLDELLAFDPLDAAERITGLEGDAAAGLGLLLAQAHGHTKREMLEGRDDTTFSNKVERYLRIASELGFEEVLRLPFTGRAWGDEAPPEETFHVLAHRDGMLLRFDTYQCLDVNGSTLYYNWRPNQGVDAWRITSSGHWHGYTNPDHTGTWVGDHDGREALRHKIQRLRDNGKLITPWVERPWMWLLHHMDTRPAGYDHDAINDKRIAMLPDWVREMITPGAA